ncbi:MAG TPA: hypothetical protein VFZ38_15865 [Vicinamibacterales bacterium]
MPPGSRLLGFARRWFDAGTVSRVFEPLLADLQREWIDAPPFCRARISVRGSLAFARSVMACAPDVLLAAPPPGMTRRVLTRIIIFTSVAAILVSVPIVWSMRDLSAPDTWWLLVLCLLPSGAALAFPFAMPWVIDAIRRRTDPNHVERSAALRIGAIAVLFSALLLGWGVPMANQVFREIAAPEHARPPARGVRELTIAELIADPARTTSDAPFTRFGSRGAIRRELNNRATLAILPAVLIWWRWGAHERRRQRWYSPLPTPVATATAIAVFFALYFSSVVVEPTLNLNPGTGLWLPVAALLLWGTAERHWARRAA